MRSLRRLGHDEMVKDRAGAVQGIERGQGRFRVEMSAAQVQDDGRAARMGLPPGRRQPIDGGQGRRARVRAGRGGLVEIDRPLAVDRDQAADAVGHLFR